MGDLEHIITQMVAELPGVVVQSVHLEQSINDFRWDAVILATVKDHPVRFLVQMKSSGYPRDMQHAISQIAHSSRFDTPVVDVPLVIAQSISEASRDLLRRHQVAYADAGGSVYIELPWALYLVDRPAPSGKPRVLRNIYRGSSAQILHALLLDADRHWHIGELAERAGVAASTAHQVCLFLEEQLWMDKAGKGPNTVRVLHEPGKLLDAWADAHSLSEYDMQRFYRWASDPDELMHAMSRALDRGGIDYALTLSSGARFVAPYVSDADRVWALVSSRAAAHLEETARAASLQSVSDGESVVLLITNERSPLLFRRQIHDLWVASDVQLYLDLWSWPRRGKEQARHLRTERIGY